MTRANSKRDAALEAARADAARSRPGVYDASGARMRTVGVHLTPFWSGAERLPIHSPRRWATFYGVTPNRVVRSALRKLDLSPRTAGAAETVPGDVELTAPIRPELVGLVSGEPERVPLAIFYDGLTLRELQDALAQLSAAGWEPDPTPQS